MPRRYVCEDCKNVRDRKGTCRFCGEVMEVLEYDTTLGNIMPYVMAGVAGLLILLSFLLNIPMAVWFAFPAIAAGLIIDHLVQRDLDRRAKEELVTRLKKGD